MAGDFYTIINREDDSQKLVDHREAWNNVTGVLESEANAEEKRRTMSDFLQGIRSELNSRNMGNETFSAYGKGYRDVYTDKERKKQAETKGTELWQKKINAGLIEKQENERRKKMRDRASEALKEAGIKSSAASPDISALSAFMGESKKDNASLLKLYRGQDRLRAILACMRSFMKYDLEGLDIRSNNKIAENSEKLERLSEQFGGIQYLITRSPELYAKLPEQKRLSFEKYYGKANTIITYYRLKKQVMLDDYFRTHENREIGTEAGSSLTADQLNLTEMIWQSVGGLAVLMKRSDDHILNGTLKDLKACLNRSGVSKDRLKLQERLRKRRKELEEKGLAGRMDEFLLKDRHIDIKGKLGIIGHARNLRALSLTGDPEKDINLLPQVMDQREVIDQTRQMREKSKTSYYLEQSDVQVGIADTAVNMINTVKRLEEDLLTIGRLTRGGGLDTAVTNDRIRLCRQRYEQDFAQYREQMAVLEASGTDRYILPKEESPDKAGYIGPENREADYLEEAKELIADLTYNKFSDVDIYNERDRICALSKKCESTEASEVLDVLAKRAVVVWERKRLLNVRAALKTDKDNRELKEEEKRLSDNEKLRGRHKDESGRIVEGKDDSLESILKLRAEAAQKAYDFRDLKAQAVHYTDQYDWALNARATAKTFSFWKASGLLSAFFWKYGSDRNKLHGEGKYQEAVERLDRLPQEITDHQAGTPFKLQRGDEAVPPVDIEDLYPDTLKDDQKARIGQIRERFTGHEEEYPAEIRTAVEAMENYVKIKYIVTTDTTEMEMAFLDKFNKDMQRSFVKLRNISFEDNIIKGLLDIMTDIRDMGRGKLRDKDNPERMTEAEFEAAKQQTAVFNKYSSDDLDESNVKDIPLFLHKPHINDIKQGYIGDCYFLSAVTAYMRSNPEGIMNMFYDIGDGNVLVRLYMAYDENNRRVDDPEEMIRPGISMRPVYVKVRKDYDISATAQDCMWVQLLEKAYVSTGTEQGAPSMDTKTGELKKLASEIAEGSPDKVMMHLTGRKDCWENQKAEPEEEEFTDKYNDDIEKIRMRQFLSGVPLWLHDYIWESIKKDPDENQKGEDGWKNTTVETVKNKVRDANKDRKDQFQMVRADILRTFKDVKPEDLDRIQNRIEKLYDRDPETIAAQVMKNINTESPQMDDGTDLADPNKVISRLYDQIEGGESVEKILSQIGGKDEYYPEIKKGAGESEEQLKKWAETTELYAKNRNKAMVEMNPGGYYSREEMIFLHDVRAAKKRREGMMFGVKLHAMDILDVQLKDNRWYILVRDTNNVHNRTYERDEEGNLKCIPGKAGFAVKKEIRSLSTDLTMGMRGTSWWELKDIFAPMILYSNAPAFEKEDNKNRLLGWVDDR